MTLRFNLVAALLCGLLSAAAPASAATVTFTTAFEITSGVGTGTNTAHLGGATFQLLGLTDTVTTPDIGTPFGSIVYSRGSEVGPLSNSFGFKLTVTQVAPPGVGVSTGLFTGSMNVAAGLANLDFITGSPIQIGNIRYTPQDIATFFAGSGGTTSILGNVTTVAVPPPLAVWGGMALFGAIAARKLGRKTVEV